jgi:hypothetical protein
MHCLTGYLSGITSAAFEPEIMARFANWTPELDQKLAITLLFALLAAFCMLRGYALGRHLAQGLRRNLQRLPGLRRNMRPNLAAALGMQVIFLALVAFSISRGGYGLLTTPDSLQSNLDIAQFLNIGLAAGTLSYFLIFLHYFQNREVGVRSPIATIFVVILLFTHVLLGMLTAFKSQVVIPLLVMGLAYFLATHRIPVRFLVMSFFALILAYEVVEPFRSYLAQQNQAPTSIEEAIGALNNSYQLRDQLRHSEEGARAGDIAERFDIAGMTMLAIDYVEHGDLQRYERREFQNSILLAPVLAFIPRVVWPEKPSYSVAGVWFNQNVLGSRYDQRTSVGMGPIGYLYLAGGVMAVILGFASFGVLQALIFEGVARAGAGGMIIFLSVAGTLVLIPSAFGPAISGLLSLLPFAFLAQMLFLRR